MGTGEHNIYGANITDSSDEPLPSEKACAYLFQRKTSLIVDLTKKRVEVMKNV